MEPATDPTATVKTTQAAIAARPEAGGNSMGTGDAPDSVTDTRMKAGDMDDGMVNGPARETTMEDSGRPPDRDTILALGEDSYMVQLLASKREDDATRLLDRWKLRDRAFHISARHKGATLYLVLTHPVNGFSEARRVLESLPRELRDRGAWIRGADGVKRMVRSADAR
ncbi:MAG: SPOR domain-containing protein [Gammaproteobacteria bacterium]